MTMLLLQEDVLFKLLRYSPPSPASRYIFTKNSNPQYLQPNKGGRGKHGRAEVFHLLRAPHHHNLGEGRDASALKQPHILVRENRYFGCL